MIFSESTYSSDSFMAFGVDMRCNHLEVSEIPPHQSARETIADLTTEADEKAVTELLHAAEEITSIVRIERQLPDGDEDLLDIFTATQVVDMSNRIHAYLGTDLAAHLAERTMPRGYPLFVGRLATYFMSSDSIITSSFGGFESRHTEPSANATGPLEKNSRGYANEVNKVLINQLKGFYQADFDITLTGPQKRVENSRIDWERGVAECQFLVLDYIRDCFSRGYTSTESTKVPPSMTVDDIAHNIRELILRRKQMVDRVTTINPFLSVQIDGAIDAAALFSLDTFHRGRPGVPRYRKEPQKARAAVYQVASLLEAAIMYEAASADQEEIPVLDL